MKGLEFGFCVLVGLISFLLLGPSSVFGATIEDLTILDRLLKSGYDRRATPTNHLNQTTPTKVYLEFFVRSFGSPNPLTMDYKVDLYLRQKWRDARLESVEFKKPLDLNDPNLVKAIWKPEVYFPNGKEADFQFVTVPNVLVRINPNGDILYMLRLKVTFSCMMDLSKFPMDKQICTMEVASFSKTVEELILEWKPEFPITTGNLGMSQFEMTEIVAAKCHESFQIGNYSCLVAEFHLHRLLGFHMVQSYLPTILMVVISWVSFWMDVNSVPGRVTLGITCLLTVSSKATNIQENIESSYVKAIDIWMGTCTAFVFLALLEFTVVNYLWRKECSRNFLRGRAQQGLPPTGGGTLSTNHIGGNLIRRTPSTLSMTTQDKMEVEHPLQANSFVPGSGRAIVTLELTHDVTTNTGHQQASPISMRAIEEVPVDSFIGSSSKGHRGEGTEVKAGVSQFNYKERAKYIDETCRYLFPFAFSIFLVVYWTYYLIF